MNRQVARALDDMTASTHTLQRTIAELTDQQVRGGSLLPGWTRGHVLTHVARNADGMVNLATWARTGVETPMYAGPEQRAADIEAGANRPAAELIADVGHSHERLLAATADLDDEQWETVVRWGRNLRETPASLIPTLRRVEVEVHHVDLDLDYTLAHLPADFVLRMLADAAHEYSGRDGIPGFVLVGNDNEGSWTIGAGGPEITGTPPSLLGWLLGRTDGIGVFSQEALPKLPSWR